MKKKTFVEDLPMIIPEQFESQTVHECSLDGPLQTLGVLFRYKMEDGGYSRT
jgi:hypothetical protein